MTETVQEEVVLEIESEQTKEEPTKEEINPKNTKQKTLF